MYKQTLKAMVLVSYLLINLQAALAGPEGNFGFASGTKVLLQSLDGNSYVETSIEETHVNDILVSCADGVCTSGKIIRAFREDGSSAIQVSLSNQKELIMGTDQKVLVECGEDSLIWTAASDLKRGDIVIGPSGNRAVVESLVSNLEADLYTFEVLPHHTYCVEDFWVHNPEHSTTIKAEVCANVKIVKGCVSVSHTIKHDQAPKTQVKKSTPIQVNPPKRVQTSGKL